MAVRKKSVKKKGKRVLAPVAKRGKGKSAPAAKARIKPKAPARSSHRSPAGVTGEHAYRRDDDR